MQRIRPTENGCSSSVAQPPQQDPCGEEPSPPLSPFPESKFDVAASLNPVRILALGSLSYRDNANDSDQMQRSLTSNGWLNAYAVLHLPL